MERQLTDALWQANLAVRAALRHSLADLHLTPVQSTDLHMISTEPGISSAELARRMRVAPQTMHRMVTDLEHRGLLTFQPRSGHGRTLDVHLTEHGQQLVAGASARAQAIEDQMTRQLDAKQHQQLIDLLKNCVDALGVSSTDLEGSPSSRGHDR